MPMIDAVIPSGALQESAELQLLRDLTEMLITLEGFDPANERAKAATWIFVHRPAVFVAGARPSLPRYRFITAVPEGQYGEGTREAVVRGVTEAVARAEGRDLPEVARRVWVFPVEIADGTWGGGGDIRRLPDIVASIDGESEREVASARLAERRRNANRALLEAVRGELQANAHQANAHQANAHQDSSTAFEPEPLV
jgi:phenylpyruvate tautomerase PptA (4-oxalocrotonate tautomerase family)